MREFSRWCFLKYWFLSHKLKHAPAPHGSASPTSSSQLETVVIRWLPVIAWHQGFLFRAPHVTMTVVSGGSQGRAPPAWVSGLWCGPRQEPCSEPGFAAKSECIYRIKSLHSRCLFRLRHWLITQCPLERPETHTSKKVGDCEVLRKKHRGRLPAQLGNKAHVCLWVEDRGGPTWHLYFPGCSPGGSRLSVTSQGWTEWAGKGI